MFPLFGDSTAKAAVLKREERREEEDKDSASPNALSMSQAGSREFIRVWIWPRHKNIDSYMILYVQTNSSYSSNSSSSVCTSEGSRYKSGMLDVASDDNLVMKDI